MRGQAEPPARVKETLASAASGSTDSRAALQEQLKNCAQMESGQLSAV